MWWWGSPRLCPAWLCDADHFAPPACPLPRENGKRREGAEGATLAWGSEGGDVVECVVQFLADGLVLHLLCIDFVWGGPGEGARWECGEREWRERGKEGERVMERENKNQREVDKDGVREIGQRTGWTAMRAPSSPLCTRLFFLWSTS